MSMESVSQKQHFILTYFGLRPKCDLVIFNLRQYIYFILTLLWFLDLISKHIKLKWDFYDTTLPVNFVCPTQVQEVLIRVSYVANMSLSLGPFTKS